MGSPCVAKAPILCPLHHPLTCVSFSLEFNLQTQSLPPLPFKFLARQVSPKLLGSRRGGAGWVSMTCIILCKPICFSPHHSGTLCHVVWVCPACSLGPGWVSQVPIPTAQMQNGSFLCPVKGVRRRWLLSCPRILCSTPFRLVRSD